MIRSVFAAALAAAMLAGPTVALAQTDMVTYGDTLRKKSSGAHSAIHAARDDANCVMHLHTAAEAVLAEAQRMEAAQVRFSQRIEKRGAARAAKR